jgi:hypothetical protein
MRQKEAAKEAAGAVDRRSIVGDSMRRVPPGFVALFCVSLLAGGALSGCGPEAAPMPVAPTSPKSYELPADSPALPFVGTYEFVGGDAEKDAVTKAIEAGVAPLSPPLVRGVARSRLNAANEVPKQMVFLGYGKWFETRVDGYRYASYLDGSPYKVETSTGDVMDLRFKFPAQAGEMMEQAFTDPAKGRVNTFEIVGNRLIMHVRVSASLLPKDITYDLTFERRGAPAEPAAADPSVEPSAATGL